MIFIYPGSFDPVTLGHVDLMTRGAKLADKLIVAVLDNPHKQPLFSIEERMDLLRDAVKDIGNIEVTAFSGLLTRFANERGVSAILRGLRDGEDYINEARYAWFNRFLGGDVETIFLPASPAFSQVSSRIVREIAAYAAPAQDGVSDPLLQWVTPKTAAVLRSKFMTKG